MMADYGVGALGGVVLIDPTTGLPYKAVGGGGGAVASVNGKTGAVVLSAGDVGAATSAQGALAATAVQPAGLTKAAVGLGSVDNTSDANKPVSTAQATAIAAKVGSDGTVKNWVAVATVADLPTVGDAATFYIVTDILA